MRPTRHSMRRTIVDRKFAVSLAAAWTASVICTDACRAGGKLPDTGATTSRISKVTASFGGTLSKITIFWEPHSLASPNSAAKPCVRPAMVTRNDTRPYGALRKTPQFHLCGLAGFSESSKPLGDICPPPPEPCRVIRSCSRKDRSPAALKMWLSASQVPSRSNFSRSSSAFHSILRAQAECAKLSSSLHSVPNCESLASVSLSRSRKSDDTLSLKRSKSYFERISTCSDRSVNPSRASRNAACCRSSNAATAVWASRKRASHTRASPRKASSNCAKDFSALVRPSSIVVCKRPRSATSFSASLRSSLTIVSMRFSNDSTRSAQKDSTCWCCLACSSFASPCCSSFARTSARSLRSAPSISFASERRVVSCAVSAAANSSETMPAAFWADSKAFWASCSLTDLSQPVSCWRWPMAVLKPSISLPISPRIDPKRCATACNSWETEL
mmetsp:Transcript_131260/g.339933  ORF Transcript_131260/g.339933 Transcript_131260/m.339933 type:complete len:445 (+) Transcript_131260:1195-2529(+)